MVSMSLRIWVEVRGVAVGEVAVLEVGGVVRVANIVNETKQGYEQRDVRKTRGNQVCYIHSINRWFLFIDSTEWETSD